MTIAYFSKGTEPALEQSTEGPELDQEGPNSAPAANPPVPSSTPEELRQQGSLAFEAGNGEQAITFFTLAIEYDTSAVVAGTSQFLQQARDGRLRNGAASRQFQRALQSLATSFFLRASAWAVLQQFDRAVMDFSNILQLDPEHALSYQGRALAYWQQGLADKALADWNAFLERQPDSVQGHMERGRFLLEQRDFAGAVADFSEAVRLARGFVQAYLYRSLALSLQGERDAALVDLREGIRLSPSGPPGDPEVTPDPGPDKHPAPATPPPEKNPVAADPPRRVKARQRGERQALKKRAEPLWDQEFEPTTRANVSCSPSSREPGEIASIEIICPACRVSQEIPRERQDGLILCPGCSTFYRMNAAGKLTEIKCERERGGERKSPGRQKPRRPSPPFGRSGFSSANLTVTAVVAAVLLGVVVLGAILFRSFTSSPLESSGAAVARAWLAQDLPRIKEYTDPDRNGDLERWLELNPPPAFVRPEQDSNPLIDVTVERNDGKTADLAFRIGSSKVSGEPLFVVIYQRWMEKDGKWVFAPDSKELQAKRSPKPRRF